MYSTSSLIILKLKDEDISKVKRFDVEKLIETNFRVSNSVETKPLPHKEIQLTEKYISIYVNYDSHIENVGRTLIDYFKNYDDILNLILGGNCQELWQCYVPYILYDDFDKVIPRQTNDIESFLAEYKQDYNYLFDGNEWKVSTWSKPFSFANLNDLINEIKEKNYKLRHNL